MTIETLPLTLKNSVMSTLDIFVEKGKRIGFEQGEKLGIDKTQNKNTHNTLQGGFSIDTICKVLEVTPEYVARAQKELN